MLIWSANSIAIPKNIDSFKIYINQILVVLQLKTKTAKPFRVFSLVDNNSVVTAIANDVGYENIFVNQLKIH